MADATIRTEAVTFTPHGPDQPEYWDTASFERFYYAQAAALHRYIYFRTGMNKTTTSEIVSEVFMALWTERRPAAGEETPLLYGIGRRKIADYFRARTRAREVRFSDLETEEREWVAGVLTGRDDDHGGPRFLSERALQLVGETLSELSASEQELLVGKYFRYLSIRELSRMQGKTEVAATSALARAREAFRTAFETRMKV